MVISRLEAVMPVMDIVPVKDHHKSTLERVLEAQAAQRVADGFRNRLNNTAAAVHLEKRPDGKRNAAVLPFTTAADFLAMREAITVDTPAPETDAPETEE